MLRIGIGNDTHRLVEGKPLILGGVRIPFERGAEGHSDGDALTHALADAILGALCEGDLGRVELAVGVRVDKRLTMNNACSARHAGNRARCG